MIRKIGVFAPIVSNGKSVLLEDGMPEVAPKQDLRAEAAGAKRALLAHLLLDDPGRPRVLIDRYELGRLFERRLDGIAWEAFSPRLKVCDSLEGAIEHLEAEMTETDAGLDGESSCTCWFTTPGADSDVVFQALQRAPNHQLIGLVFGPWPHGSAVYALGNVMRPGGRQLSEELCEMSPMTEEEAFRALSMRSI